MNDKVKEYLKKAKDQYFGDQDPATDAVIDNFDPDLMAEHIMELDTSLTRRQALDAVIRELHSWNQIGAEAVE